MDKNYFDILIEEKIDKLVDKINSYKNDGFSISVDKNNFNVYIDGETHEIEFGEDFYMEVKQNNSYNGDEFTLKANVLYEDLNYCKSFSIKNLQYIDCTLKICNEELGNIIFIEEEWFIEQGYNQFLQDFEKMWKYLYVSLYSFKEDILQLFPDNGTFEN